MTLNNSAQDGPIHSIRLSRDGKAALTFNGECIGSATRTDELRGDDDKMRSYTISARLFKTSDDEYVVGIVVYNNTDQEYESRDAFINKSLNKLGDELNEEFCRGNRVLAWVGDDLLGELFKDTKMASRYVDQIA
jgi:hypothetical protein